MVADIATLTTIHTALSFVALAAGVPAMLALLGSPVGSFWTVLFLVTAAATSLTGFAFPFIGVTPAFAVGILASLILAAVIAARYAFRLAGPWRRVDATGLVASLYLLVFVAVAQAFSKIAVLHAAAPTQSEPPFAVAQAVVLIAFVVLGIAAVRRVHPVAA